jgi:secondary thiamine-phosphate synthase enzyme
MLKKIQIQTTSRTQLINVDGPVSVVLKESGVTDGVCFIWIPHTTAGITINENADPSVAVDILNEMNKIIPYDNGYRHVEGNSAAHIKSSLFSPSLSIIITGGKLLLGTWQSLFFCEFDGPRSRFMYVKILEG